MRLAIVRQRYTPYGGAERFIERALAALAARGVELTIVTRAWPRDAAPGATPLIVDPPHLGRTWRQWSFDRGACAALARVPATLVQSHERIACCDVFRAGDGVHAVWLEAKREGAGPFERAALALSPFHHYLVAAERRLFASPRLKVVICISKMVQREIHARFGLPLARLPVIYNAIDGAVFHPGLREHRDDVRAHLGIAADATVFLLVGSGFERKGVGRAIEALAQLAPPAHLVVVGRDRHAPRFMRLAQRLGVGTRVSFAGPQQDPKPYYGAADVFVLPTLYDALSNAVLEALACGLPVITSDRCGAGELVAAHDAGTIVGARDVAGLAAAMGALAADPARRGRAGTNARAAVASLTPDAMAARLVALYDALLAGQA